MFEDAGLPEPNATRQLIVDKLCVFAGEKQILHEVSVVVSSCSLLAVMGPSGSGKTTFMDALSGRSILTSGSISVGDKPVSRRLQKSFGYVTQMDVFFSGLTLRQTIEFAAKVTLSDAVTGVERRARIENVISTLELKKCMDTVMGDFAMPGLSGGEKKRAHIACELLRNPDVLLLDEPTSGLDSSMAMTLVQLLGRWSRLGNKIVIASIHQPSSQVFYSFEDLLLLTDGRISYCGKRSGMVDYFESIGVPFQKHWNPADCMLEVVKSTAGSKSRIIQEGARFSVLKNREIADQLAETVGHSIEGFASSPEQSAPWPSIVKPSIDSSVSWGRQLKALIVRGFHLERSRSVSALRVIQTLLVGVMCSMLWLQITRTEEHIGDILGCVFFTVWNMSYRPLFEAIASLHEDITIVKHERRAGMYQIGAYYSAKMVTEMPLVIISPLVSLSLVYWIAGLGNGAEYAPFVLGVLINNLAFQSVGTFIALLTDNAQANVTLAYSLMMFCGLFGGYLTTSYPAWLEWAKYLSFTRYCYHYCLQLTVLSSANFVCSTSLTSTYPSCRNGTLRNANNQTVFPSTEILQYFPDQQLPVWWNIAIVILLLIIFRLAGYLWLRCIRNL